jgi:hypothetical protein
MMRVYGAASLAALASLLALACSGSHGATKADGGSGSGHEAGTIHDYSPTLTAIYTEIFSRQCAIPFCHGGAAGSPPSFSSKDDSYQALVNVPANGMKCADAGMGGLLLVVPGQPDMSLLYMKVEQPSPPGLCGDPMPGNGPPLEAMQIQQIQEWIAQGAQND